MRGDYREITRRLQRLSKGWEGLQLHLLGEAGTSARRYPLYSLRLKRRRAGQAICLSAGIHGDEPAGVEALLRFLEGCQADPQRAKELSRHSLTIFPCINPSGYERGKRENAEGVDLNRQFDYPDAPTEVRLLRAALERERFDLSLELHEDPDAQGFYLYELGRDGMPFWGESIVTSVGFRHPIDRRSRIDGRKASAGVIRPDATDHRFDRVWRRRKGWPQAIYQFIRGVPHTITTETPAKAAWEARVAMHLVALDAIFSRLTKK